MNDASDTSDASDASSDASSSRTSFGIDGTSDTSDASDDSSTESVDLDEICGVEENGRTYPSYGKYQYGLPADELEQDRLDLKHHLITVLVYKGRLHLAPLTERPQRILDLGCGTGIWAMDMADKYPSAVVTGCDIASIQPQFVPTNCVFQIFDIESNWNFRGEYDFIHARDLVLTIRDWDELLMKALGCLRPGGYSIPEDSFLLGLCGLFSQIGDAMGTPINAPTTWKHRMERLGFEDVKVTIDKLPIGEWPEDPRYKTIGQYEACNIYFGLEACLMRGYTQFLAGDLEKLQIQMAGARHELRNRRMHSYFYQ